MMSPVRLLQSFCVSMVVAAGSAGAVHAADVTAASEKDPLRATLLESREKNRGVTVHAAGANIAMVVTAIDGVYVIGRSQAATRIVVRLDRIDGVSAAF
jgi:TRAP-type mannitol/chloroaromatic compound transport system substrate-binding protein